MKGLFSHSEIVLLFVGSTHVALSNPLPEKALKRTPYFIHQRNPSSCSRLGDPSSIPLLFDRLGLIHQELPHPRSQESEITKV